MLTLKDSRLVPNCISLIHSLVEVIVNLFALFVDQCTPLVNDFNLLALFAFDGNLQSLLILADIIYLFFEVHNQPLHRIDQMILALQLQGQLVLFLLETLTVLLKVSDVSSGIGDISREMLVAICLHIN